MSARIFLGSCLLVASQLASGIVDVHDEYYSNPDVAAFSTFAFNFEGATGNKEQHDYEIENHTIVRHDQSTFMAIGALGFAETNNTKSEDNQFVHLRYVRHVLGPHGFDVLAQYGKDEFELLERRTVYGAGYRYEWQRGPGDQRGLFGAGVIREQERYVNRSAEQDLWRANLYVTLARPLNFLRETDLTLSAYAQPALEDANDVRAIAVLTLTARLTERLAITLGLDYRHDSDPEPGIDSTNFEYSSGITFTLR